MKEILFTLCFSFLILSNGKAQPKPTCFTEQQLLYIQKSSQREIDTFLTNQGWSKQNHQINQMKQYFDYSLDYSVDTWEKKTSILYEGTIYIYFRENFPNVIIYQTTNSCFINIQNSLQTNLVQKEISQYKTSFLHQQDGVIIEFRDYYNDTSSKRFSIIIYNGSSLNNLILKEKAEIEAEEARVFAEKEKKRKAEEDRKIRYNLALKNGNDLFLQKKYEEAIAQYELAKLNTLSKDTDDLIHIEQQIKNSEKGIIQLAFENRIKSGDIFFEQKKFGNALSEYEQALKIENENIEVIKKIENIKNILNILELQKEEQSYLKINPNDFFDFRETNFKTLNLLIKHAKDEGRLNFASNIKFDSLGNNQSTLRINSISDKKLIPYLQHGINVFKIPPPKISDYYIPSQEILNFNLSWKTKIVKATVKSKNISIDKTKFPEFQHSSEIRSFINQQMKRNGIYKFEVIEKELNNTLYEDIKLTEYHYNSGPMNFVYSALLPGLGTKKVTDRKISSERMALFLISAALSVGSKLYSDNQYKMYKNETSEYKMGSYYDNADVFNKIFLISGGIAASIYIYDIIYVFSKGIKNNNQSKYLKNRLRQNGSIPLLESPFKP